MAEHSSQEDEGQPGHNPVAKDPEGAFLEGHAAEAGEPDRQHGRGPEMEEVHRVQEQANVTGRGQASSEEGERGPAGRIAGSADEQRRDDGTQREDDARQGDDFEGFQVGKAGSEEGAADEPEEEGRPEGPGERAG